MKTLAVRPRVAAHGRRPALTHNGRGHSQTAAPRTDLKVSPALAAWLKKPKHNLIGGKWTAAASGKSLEVFNPADASVITRVPDSDKEDINRAVAAARRAFEFSPWRIMTPSERGKLVWRIGDLILQNTDELAELE